MLGREYEPTRLIFKRSAWIKPDEDGQQVLIFNKGDGYHVAYWDQKNFCFAEFNGVPFPMEMAELWVELPPADTLISLLCDKAMLEVETNQLRKTILHSLSITGA